MFPHSTPDSSSRTRSKLFGLLVRKECWGPSWRGWLATLFIALAGGWCFLLTVHPFLAVTHREETDTLVVEGWVGFYGLNGAMQEFKDGHYNRVITTGGPVEGAGRFSSVYSTEANRSAGLLKKAGIPEAQVQIVPSQYVGRDRTYNSALALRDWLRANDPSLQRINVLTEDTHARRTWLLFQAALGRQVRVGIIAVPNPDYDASHWWHYSEGVRAVIDESIAYLYAKFLFWPSNQPEKK